VKLGPDFNGMDAAKSGYMPSGNLTGISLMHESGTGGSPKYGVISQLPVVGNVVDLSVTSKYVSRVVPDAASVGYYNMSLQTGLVELAGTAHVGFLQYSFPPGQQANILVDVSHYLPASKKSILSQSFTNGSIQLYPDGHYEGSGTYQGGWNLSPAWTVYFCGRFSESAASARTFGSTSAANPAQFSTNLSAAGTTQVGALFSFNSSKITSQVGFSFISTSKACQYIDTEVPPGTGLSDLVSKSKDAWNSQVLSKVTTTETNQTLLGQLYTSLYGMHLLPSNRTGENPNPNWDIEVPYYDDLYTFWDLFRCTTPLFHILQPVMYEELLRSVVEIYRTEGYMPDGRSSNFNGRSQGGSNADNILADAYVKGVRGNLNWTLAYEAMVKDAEVTPPNNNDPQAKDSSTQQGRGALPDWHSLGYITTKYTRSVSRAVEYSVNDFSLHQVASGLGKTADANKYLPRSRNWRNHWDPTVTSQGTSGFLVPRKPGGTFVKQNASTCGGCWWGDDYYEGKPWEYSVNPHHDLSALITMGGGWDNFTQRLNTLLDPSNHLVNMGNEPSFASPYLYNFVNQQSLSVKASRSIARLQYQPGPAGLPGNSDAGAMQSWLLWNMIGLYPLTGQTTFLIHSPWFSNLRIDLGNGKNLTITSTNGTTAGLASDAIYVQSLRVNGQSWTKNWLTWNDVFANGGTLDFELGTAMTHWDAKGTLPPSPASGGDQTGAKDSNYLSQLDAASRARRLKKVAIGVGSVFAALWVACLALAAWFLSLFCRTKKVVALKDVEEDGNAAGKGQTDEAAEDQIHETPRKTSLSTDEDEKEEDHSVFMVKVTEILPTYNVREGENEERTFYDDNDDD
jgi:predicted alpha-1,2-mannosidase